MVYIWTHLDTWTVLMTTVGVLLTYWITKRFLHRRTYKLPPGPTGLPLLGHIGSIDHLALWDHRDLYGDVSYINVLGTHLVVLNSVEAIRGALQGQQTAGLMNERPSTFLKRFIIYDDIVYRSASAENWKHLRKLFHSIMRQYGDGKIELEQNVHQELRTMIQLLTKTIGTDIDIAEYLEPSLLNTLHILIVGERYGYDHWRITETRQGMTHLNAIANPFTDTILNTMPILRFLPFGIGTTFREVKKYYAKMFNYVLNMRGNSSDSKQKRSGIVQELYHAKENNDWISEAAIKGVIQNIGDAGFLSTRGSIYSFFLIMLHYPEIQTKIQNEIDEVVDRLRCPDISDRHNMPFTQAAILELTRFSSVVPVSIPHACARDTGFRGYTVPSGSVILPNLFRVHHDNDLWIEPWRFNPSRFLDDSGNLLTASHPKRQNLIPFGVGKRACPGEVFANTRIFLYITNLLQVFRYEPADYLPLCDPREFVRGVVLSPAAYKLKLVKR